MLSDALPQMVAFTSKGIDDLVSAGQISKAPSLELLAQMIGVPAENLIGATERYNGHVDRGSDDDYLKPAKYLRPITTPPYYAFPIDLYLFGLTGVGIRVDHQARAVHRTSRPIPGLFAAGECAGGVLGSVYIGSGNSLGSSMTYGRVAGRNAAAFAREGDVPPVDWRRLAELADAH